MSGRLQGKRTADCSGVISAVAFGLFVVAGSLLLFYLLSGPPTFLESVVLAPGDTLFHNFTWSRNWCNCALLRSLNNHTPTDVTLRKLPLSASPPLTGTAAYAVSQIVNDAFVQFEYWEVYLHPGSRGVATFNFSQPVTFYFAPRYYVDGQDHDPDYADHYVILLKNVTQGTVYTPNITESGGWAFVWEKDFKLQAQTTGVVNYTFELTEFAIPNVSENDTVVGEGTFCWDFGEEASAWFLSARSDAVLDPVNRLMANLYCVPRYPLTIPITAIPVVIAVVLEILIIVFCIIRPRKRHLGYIQV